MNGSVASIHNFLGHCSPVIIIVFPRIPNNSTLTHLTMVVLELTVGDSRGKIIRVHWSQIGSIRGACLQRWIHFIWCGVVNRLGRVYIRTWRFNRPYCWWLPASRAQLMITFSSTHHDNVSMQSPIR